MLVPEGKDEMIRESEKKVAKIDRKYKRGFITDQERYRLTVAEWEETTKKVTAKLQANMKEQRYNPIHMMLIPVPVVLSTRSVSWPVCEPDGICLR